jgi:outer membrane protein
MIMTSVPIRDALRTAELRRGRNVITSLLVLTVLAVCASHAGAQQAPTPGRPGTVRLSLDDALRLAQGQSQTVDIARAGVTRATGQRAQARAQALPQLNGTAGYTRTIKSQFSALAAATPVKDTVTTPTTQSLCTPFVPTNATPEARAAALAQAATCPSAAGGGLDFTKTSFGAANQWALGLAFSQNLFTAGRVSAQNDAAEAQLRSANIEVSAQRAQLSLDVTSAYYDAVLAEQLVVIADSSVAETDALLSQTKVAKQVGNASEYELLRAQVTHDNQLPVAIQARSNREVAYLRVKQLLNISLDDTLTLTTRIEEASGPALPAIATNATPDTSVSSRAPVRELDEAVRASEAQVRIARSQRIPSLALVSSYQRLYFPANAFPSLGNGVNNWTVGFSSNFPILDGGRIRGDEIVAQAGVQQIKAQRDQARLFAGLDTRVALNALQQAQASWDASRGTSEQAQRAYAIDQVRFREGISTQTDLAQSRLLLEQALANRAQAARNLAVAKVRLALLRDLPLQTGTAGASASQNGGGAAPQQQQQSQQRSGSSSQPASGGAPGSSQP